MALLTLIAALGRDRAIGRGNDLLWHCAQDQQHFRRATLGCPVIMGRKTWDSLPARFRPLPGRRNLVLSRDPGWRAEGAEAVGSLDRALALTTDSPQVFVIGGAQVYDLALPRADALLLTEIDAAFPDADAHFPAWDASRFQCTSSESHTDPQGIGYRFARYERRNEG